MQPENKSSSTTWADQFVTTVLYNCYEENNRSQVNETRKHTLDDKLPNILAARE